ncbi:Gfo/Idh/MocA family protein [Haladaptatus pallidirubidus]|uniref:Gfo/Idh/MocA family protein n=1 Tax=Haladaptatus pallidirubidus TaxID=1008152 RepID=UPI0035EA238C
MQRIGLVGSGFMAMAHANSYQEMADAEVVAVASLDDDREAFAAENTPNASVYNDAEKMMEEADITAVDICTPTPTHRPFVEAAADHGLNTFCEKPLARTVADTNAIVDAVTDASITFMTGHVLRYFPEYVEAKRRIDAGEVGTLEHYTPSVSHHRRDMALTHGSATKNKVGVSYSIWQFMTSIISAGLLVRLSACLPAQPNGMTVI